VANEDGTGFFTASNQAYYLYNQILDPYQISTSKSWQFQITGDVTTFTFSVYISAPMPNETIDVGMMINETWDGGSSTDWSLGANWVDGSVPADSSGVYIPAGTTFAPVMVGDDGLMHLRVANTAILNGGGFNLTAGGNVDAVGTLTNGTLTLTGTGALLRGNVNRLQVSGSTSLQGATKATGAVAITGSLTTNGNALTISIP
jgi:hypothetical protein